MRRIRLVTRAALIVLSATFAAAQTATSQTLSTALRAHLKTERFQVVTSVRGLPLGVREELQRLFGSSSLELAEPGAPFQVTDDIASPRLPIRRMVVAGCSMDHCLVYYERGGVAHIWQAALFHWTPDETRVEWSGTAPNSLATVDDIRNAMLSGTIKGPIKFW